MYMQQIELKVDTSNMKFAHEGIDWNSKKIGEYHFIKH